MTLELESLKHEVEQCRKCPLWEGRTHAVFGEGNPHASILLVGEAPGRQEDLQGVPFVGAAGKYLDELLDIAGLTRDDIFIANVLKCRPPSNRDPKVEEIQECADYLRDQTRLIHPEIIVTLGNFATKFILKTDRGITGLRGTPVQLGSFIILPMFHPAAAIYDRSKKELLENDFSLLGSLVKAKNR